MRGSMNLEPGARIGPYEIRESLGRGGPPTLAWSPLEFAAPKALFRDTFVRTQGTQHTHFDVAPDGRFLMIESPKPTVVSNRQDVQIILNWTEELKRIAPVKK